MMNWSRFHIFADIGSAQWTGASKDQSSNKPNFELARIWAQGQWQPVWWGRSNWGLAERDVGVPQQPPLLWTRRFFLEWCIMEEHQCSVTFNFFEFIFIKSKQLMFYYYLLWFSESYSRIANVHLSVHHQTPSASQNCSYQPSSLLTIKPINHWAYQPLSLLTIKPIKLWSSFVTFKPFGLFNNCGLVRGPKSL